MNNNMRMELLTEICRIQAGTDKYDGNGTAPVSVKIGYVAVDGTVMDNGILITDCPPAIVSTVSRWVDAVNSDGHTIATASVFNGGLLVS